MPWRIKSSNGPDPTRRTYVWHACSRPPCFPSLSEKIASCELTCFHTYLCSLEGVLAVLSRWAVLCFFASFDYLFYIRQPSSFKFLHVPCLISTLCLVALHEQSLLPGSTSSGSVRTQQEATRDTLDSSWHSIHHLSSPTSILSNFLNHIMNLSHLLDFFFCISSYLHFPVQCSRFQQSS